MVPVSTRRSLAILVEIVLTVLAGVGCISLGSGAPQATSAAGDATTLGRAYVYAGLPVPTVPEMQVEVLPSKGYLVGYSEQRKDPLWAAYHLFPVQNPETHPRPSRFSVDSRTTAQVSHDDYTGTGYDRGHMAPNHAIDTRYGREAQLETFLLSNICPQKPNLNRRVWEKLEEKATDDYANRLPNVWVTSGPIFDANVERLPCGVEIPDAFYSIVVAEPQGSPRALAFIVPQTVSGAEPLPQFLRSIDEIERKTGLNFLAGLQDNVERALEKEPAPAMW